MMMMAMSQVMGTVDQRCECTLYVRAFLPGKQWTGISFTTNPDKWRITLCSLKVMNTVIQNWTLLNKQTLSAFTIVRPMLTT
jgi:hypothetical protein